jgi:hypothetical protein
VIEKVCRGCGKEKLATAFHKHAQMRDGRLNYCKVCTYEAMKTVPSRSPEGRREEYRRQCERLGLGVPGFRRKRLTDDERRAYKRNWERAKKGTPLDAPIRNDAGRSPEYYRARYAALEMKRIAAKKRRTPPWLNQAHFAEIEGQYHFAKVMEQITGQKHHVDHIEPLQGEDVSGLHVPWNLQAIPALANFAKGNRRIEAYG